MTPSNSQKWIAGEIGFDHFGFCHAILIHVSVQKNLRLISRIEITLQEALGKKFELS